MGLLSFPVAFLSLLAREVGGRECVLVLSLCLIAKGLWDWWRPGAYLVPGVVLLWIALPIRPPFVLRQRHDTPDDVLTRKRQVH